MKLKFIIFSLFFVSGCKDLFSCFDQCVRNQMNWRDWNDKGEVEKASEVCLKACNPKPEPCAYP